MTYRPTAGMAAASSRISAIEICSPTEGSVSTSRSWATRRSASSAENCCRSASNTLASLSRTEAVIGRWLDSSWFT